LNQSRGTAIWFSRFLHGLRESDGLGPPDLGSRRLDRLLSGAHPADDLPATAGLHPGVRELPPEAGAAARSVAVVVHVFRGVVHDHGVVAECLDVERFQVVRQIPAILTDVSYPLANVALARRRRPH
jgi:hypothetical protein